MSTSTLHRLLLALALASLLPACATSSKRSATAPTPPAIDCEQGTVSKPVPPLPVAWVDQVGQLSVDAAGWVADVLGIVEQERLTDRGEAECYQRHREAGVIR